METMAGLAVAASGLTIGAIAGFFVHRARLCTFGAIEDAVIGGDTRRLRVFAFALGIAVLLTQALIVAGILQPDRTTYVPAALPWIGIVAGSFAFGLGMALVGTCSFGSLVRLGAGDLRSIVVIAVFGATAYLVLRGNLSSYRIEVFESLPFSVHAAARMDAPAVLGAWSGRELRLLLAMLVGGSLVWLALGDRRLHSKPRLLTAGLALGLCIGSGWLATATLFDEFVAAAAKPQSLTFVAPVARAGYALLQSAPALIDFGVATVFGAVFGAAFSAILAKEFRWEAFDDPREMRRHIAGAALMGFGGILAGGCTIGQGLTAGSILALSWPLAVGGMYLGARLGIAILVEGSFRDFAKRLLASRGDT
jgi:hypothetical protein